MNSIFSQEPVNCRNVEKAA